MFGRKMNNIRSTIKHEIIDKDIAELSKRLNEEYSDKGYHSSISAHETIGVIDEEFNELKAAIHDNNENQIIKELFDIVVAAMWGINSLERDRK